MEEQKENEITSQIENVTQKNWLEEETEELKETSFDGERLPSLKLEPNKVVTVSIDVSVPFDKWVDKENNIVKKIIPCMVNNEKYVWWLNVRNPIYSEIILRSRKTYPEPLVIKVLQTGTQKDTRYNIIED